MSVHAGALRRPKDAGEGGLIARPVGPLGKPLVLDGRRPIRRRPAWRLMQQPVVRTFDIARDLIEAREGRLRGMRTFGQPDLDRLAQLRSNADESITLREAFERQFKRPERFLAVRHDMDHDLANSLRFAEWEAANGIRATYYVLHNDWYWGDDPATPSKFVLDGLERIASLGHEIGLHNNAIATGLRLDVDPVLVLDRALGALRRHGFDVVGSATHGDALCREVGFVNHEVFTETARPAMGDADRTIVWHDKDGGERQVRLHPLSMTEFGLTYEAYKIGSSLYMSDTGGRWHRRWDDVERHFTEEGAYLQLLIHPVWWAFSGERLREVPQVVDQGPVAQQISHNAAENAAAPVGERTAEITVATTASNPSPPTPVRQQRSSGDSMKIIVRGDCCSRRAINMNADLFGGRPIQIRDEKCRSDFFLDHLVVGSPTRDDIAEYLKVEEMHKTLRHYAEEQISRNVLEPTDADLIVMDSYADMNFAAWRHRTKGWKLWVHPKFIRDQARFDQDFENVGSLSLQESIEAHIGLIEVLRERNGHLPVLFLSQPVAYYAKLRDERSEFANLGAELEKRVPDLYWGEIADRVLGPDDMNSCGPGQTLHFTGQTYRRMIAHALDKGLDRWLPQAAAIIAADPPNANGSSPTDSPALAQTPAQLGATPEVQAAAAVAAGQPSAASEPPMALQQPPDPAASMTPQAHPAPPAGPASRISPPRRFSDEVTVSFLRADTDDRHCAALADMLYGKFTAPHPRVPGLGAYQDGCSILMLPESYDEWLRTVSYVRRKLRRAERQGYSFGEIDRTRYVDDVHEINTSMAERQGKPMTDAYRLRPKFGPLPNYTCPRHRLVTYGVLDAHGKLVAYTWVYQVGQMCLFSTILGHGDHLEEGVMYVLIAGAVRDLLATSGTRYAMYNMHNSGGEGLRFFKERMGFRGYWVNWQLEGLARRGEDRGAA